MPTMKTKVSDFAADLNLSAQEVIDMLGGDKPQKPSSSLSEQEMNTILERFTQAHQVESFDAYFENRRVGGVREEKKSAEEKKTAAKPQRIQPTKKMEQSEKNTKQKQTAPKTKNQPVKEAAPAKEAAVAKTSAPAPKTTTAPAEAKTAPEQETATVTAPVQEKPRVLTAAETERRARERAEQYAKQQAERNARQQQKKQQQQKQNAQKSATPQKSQPKPQTTPVSEQTAPKQNPPVAAPVRKTVESPKVATPNQKSVTKEAMPQPERRTHKQPKKPAKAQERGERTKLQVDFATTESPAGQPRRTVDTRGSYVDLDKYNERYEQIAPQGRGRDAFGSASKKQKITQKSQQRKQQQHSNKQRGETEAEKLRRLELERARKQQLKVLIPDTIVVSELASRLKVQVRDVMKKLMGLGVMATINEEIDFDTASLVAEELGAKVVHEVVMTIEERLIEDEVDDVDALKERCPVVVVMGHVDHGKTSILDSIRHANVTASEAGGITQHIGAYQVQHNGKTITFLDTPGHEAFTAMRARGANITDIAILVVAADDGIMPQTIESIHHAKAAGITVVVAINKMDKEGANPERIKQQLTEHELVPEEWGGDTICVPVSAKTGMGIDDLLENVLLVAEMAELKANPNRRAKGTVIEARLDKGRGPIATILVQNGTLHTGDVIIAGTAVGKVRVMTNHRGEVVTEAGPSVPVEITGLAEVPSAGDTFNAVEDERLARELVDQRKHEAKEEQFRSFRKVTLDNLFSQIAEGEMKELPIIVKADVQGSVEAVKQSLERLSNDEVRVSVIHGAVGAISESDVMLATSSNAIIVGFNVRPMPVAAESAARDGVDIRLYRIIYDAIEEISTAMKGMLAPKYREVQDARIEVRQVYHISSVGTVAGCYVLEGKVNRQCQIRVVRDGIVISEDKIDSLRRFKDDVKEVATGYECGISLEKFSDMKEGDILEAFRMEEYREE